MKKLVRAAVAGTAAALITVAGTASPALAGVYSISVSYNGEVKARATWDNDIDQLCVNLLKGYRATATINGNSITDYSAGNGQVCIWVNNVSSNSFYDFRIAWDGTGGGYATNHTSVRG